MLNKWRKKMDKNKEKQIAQLRQIRINQLLNTLELISAVNFPMSDYVFAITRHLAEITYGLNKVNPDNFDREKILKMISDVFNENYEEIERLNSPIIQKGNIKNQKSANMLQTLVNLHNTKKKQ